MSVEYFGDSGTHTDILSGHYGCNSCPTPFFVIFSHFLDTLKYFKTFKKKVILLQTLVNMSVKHLGVMGTQTYNLYGYNGSKFVGHPAVLKNNCFESYSFTSP
jgi:hypothetical protein